MTHDAGPQPAAHQALEVIPAGAAAMARRIRATRRRRRTAWYWIFLGILCSRRVVTEVIVAVLGLAAAVRLARESQTRNLARLAAWDKRQALRHQRTAK